MPIILSKIGVCFTVLWALDPYRLPLEKTVYEFTQLKGIPGALRDASPDAWGRQHGRCPSQVNRFRMVNPRVFGSVLHGTDRPGLAKALEMLREGATLAVYAELV